MAVDDYRSRTLVSSAPARPAPADLESINRDLEITPMPNDGRSLPKKTVQTVGGTGEGGAPGSVAGVPGGAAGGMR